MASVASGAPTALVPGGLGWGGGGGTEERVVCFVCDFAVDQLLRQGWRTPARIITLVYTEMKTQKDAALAYRQNNGEIPTFAWRRSPGQNCPQIK